MDEQKKKKKDPTYYVEGKEYPVKPGVGDYISEAFEPTNTRAQLEVLRRRRVSR